MVSTFLASAVEVSGKLHAPAILPQEKKHSVLIGWKAGWVGPTAGLDALQKRKVSCLCRE
jgi:hypothetical protein